MCPDISFSPELFLPLAAIANPVEVRGLLRLVCAPAPLHDFVARTLNADEESLLHVCGGFKIAPPHLPGLGAIRIAPDGYRGRAEQSTGQKEGEDEHPRRVAARSHGNPLLTISSMTTTIMEAE
jgi:hypothetical protein